MRMKTQRILAAILSLVLLLALAPAGWAEGGDETGGSVLEGSGTGESVSLPAAGVVLTNNNSVVINLVPADKVTAEDQTFANEMKKAKVEADLYLIAPAVADPMYDTYSYTFADGSAFAGLKDRVNEALKTDPTKPATTREDMLKSFSPIAQAAAGIAKGPSVNPTKVQAAAENATEITVGKLPAGMYLLILRGADLAKNETETGYFTTAKKSGTGEYADPTNPGQDVTITVTRALSDNYEFLFEPQIITLPTKMVETAQGTAQSYNTAYGEWSEILNITAKPDWKPRNGILKITKTLTNYADLSKEDRYFEPITFAFSVVGIKDGNTVYQKVVALSVNSPVDEELVATLEDIPIGTTVTVTEVYEGAHAELDPDAEPNPQTVVIQSPNPTTAADGTTTTVTSNVNFTNVNNKKHRGGHGIENKFTFNKSTGGWGWVATGGDGATSGNEVEE